MPIHLNDLTADSTGGHGAEGGKCDCGHYSREIRLVREFNMCFEKKNNRKSRKPVGQKGYKASFQLNWHKVKACQGNNCSKTEIVRHC